MSKISSKVLKRKFWNLLIDILIRESDKKVDINERVIMNEAFVEPYDRNHDTII